MIIILKNGQDGYAMVAPQLQIQLNLFIIILIVIFLIKAHLYQDYKMLKMFYLKNLIQESNGMEIIITNTAINQTNVGNCNCGSYQFYSKLYKNKFTPCEHTIIDYINNYSDFVLPQIQEFTINHVVPNELKIININENIQDNWTKFNKEKRINECLNVIFKSNNLINMGNELYTIAWDIINSIKSILKKDEWKSKKHFIITFVLIGSNQINELNEIQIAAWRIQCYLYAGITNLN